jgi:hypothetical protein
MLSHASYGNNDSITNTSYNIKYASSPHNTRSLASRPRILQLFYLRSIGYKTHKKDKIEGCFVENTARSYILAEDLRNTDWFQHILNSPIISFSVCIGGFRPFARVIPQNEPKQRANKITEGIHGKYHCNKRHIVDLTPESNIVRYTK